MRVGRFAVVFDPGDPPRGGVVHFWDPDGVRSGSTTDAGEGAQPADNLGDWGESAELELALPIDGTVAVRTVSTRCLPIAQAVGLLASARDDQEAHESVRFFSAVAVTALNLAARGRLLPGVSPEGFDAWRMGPLDLSDMRRIRSLAAATPALARAIPLDSAAEKLFLGDAEELVRSFLDAVADVFPRTPAAEAITDAPEYARQEPVEAEGLRDWAQKAAVGVDSGLRLALRIEVPGGDFDNGAFHAVVRLRSLADPTKVTDAEALWAGDEHGFGERATFEAMLAVRASAPLWTPLESLLDQAEPVALELADDELTDLLGGAEERLADAGIDIEWPMELSRELDTRTVISAGGDQPADPGAFFRSGAIMPLSWQLTFEGEPLTDVETERIATGRPVTRLRGKWILVEPGIAERGCARELPSLSGYDALAAALIGTTVVERERVGVVAEGWLGDLVECLRDADGGPEPLGEPDELAATLRDYQLRGLRWMERMTSFGFGCCLADDMGLGKTIMLIALHLRRQLDPATAGPTLVVCPASLLGNWEREIEKFAPGTPVHRFHGSSRSPAGREHGFVVTTYGTMRVDPEALKYQPWSMVVVDEAQHVKNRLSGTAKALREIPAQARVALTGTPVENNLSELWAILDWTTPWLLGTSRDFRAHWSRPVEVDRNNAVVERLSRYVSPFLLRRKKSDPGIAPELPRKSETDHPLVLTDEQAALYEKVVDGVLDEIRGSDSVIARHGLVLKLLVALKQVCNHPAHYLGEQGNPEASRSEKLQLLDELLETIIAGDGAALVFTQYVQMGKLLERHLTERGIPAQLLHGGVPVRKREEMVRRFQDGEVPVFLLSLKAGGTGLNLTRADHVVHFDRWWNPAVEEQGTDRAYRIGQTKPVQVHRFVAEDTLEDRIATLLETKRELSDALLSGGEAALSELSDLELRQLVELRRS